MLDVFIQHSEKVAKILLNSNEIEIQNVFQRFTLDSIGMIAFGKSFDTLGDKATKDVPFAIAFDNVQSQLIKDFIDPFFKLKRMLNMDKNSKAYWKNIKVVNDFAYKMVDEIRSLQMKEPEKFKMRNDLLGLFTQRTDHEGKPFSDRFLRDVVLNFLIAGRDTTANSLSWSMFRLIRHADWQHKLRDECKNISMHNPTETIDVAVLNKHILMKAFLTEVLRLHPSVPLDGKYVIS